MKPSSFCTMCTKPCSNELFGFLISLSIHHPGEIIIVLTDTKTKEEYDLLSYKPNLSIEWAIELDQYSELNRNQMTQMGIWSEFQMKKAHVIDIALKKYVDTLFLDSDIIICDIIDSIDNTKDIGVSPGFINKETSDKVGYYNGGMLWTKNKNVPDMWRNFTKTSRYFDQASIEDLVKSFSFFEFGENYNVQSWRFLVGHESANDYKKRFYADIKQNKVMFDKRPLKFIHTHFNDKRFYNINNFFIELLNKSKSFKELMCIFRIIHGKWIISIPKQPMKGLGNHKNDSFREIPILLRTRYNDVDIIFDNNSIHCKILPNIILYDRPTLQWVDNDFLKGSHILLGNGDINVEGMQLKHKIPNLSIMPWTFWPRRPMLVEKLLKSNGVLPFESRNIKSIFIGNYENSVQEKFRNKGDEWNKYIEEFHNTSGSKHKFTHEEYLMKLRDSKFGLCLRGYGSKCHREVELMAFGTIPIITPEVSIESYMDPPKEGVHYIRIKKPSDIIEKINSYETEDLINMSNECHSWFMKNVHSSGIWENMMRNMFSYKTI